MFMENFKWEGFTQFKLKKWILLSFPQFLSIRAIILHEVQQFTQTMFHQFDQHAQMRKKVLF
jgi:hypothetical protein